MRGRPVPTFGYIGAAERRLAIAGAEEAQVAQLKEPGMGAGAEGTSTPHRILGVDKDDAYRAVLAAKIDLSVDEVRAHFVNRTESRACERLNARSTMRLLALIS